ncbi:MAG: hypothetical protein JWQ64_3838 [Subtercola sp.]|jgi:hypothetical protein|nr:hypothetical protein [Subtercola sp.]
MPLLKEIQQYWDRAFTHAARHRGLRTVGGYGYTDDGIHVASVALVISRRSDPLRISWWVEIKPLKLDDILRDAFLPTLDVGPAKRRSLRVNGAFAAPALRLDRGEYLVALVEEPASTVNAVLDRFEDLRTEYLRVAPDPHDFIDQAQLRASDANSVSPSARLREALALVVAHRNDEAVRLLRNELDNHRHGPMGGPDGDVFDLLLKYLER